MEMHHTNKTGNANTMQYKKLLLMVILSYIAMYILMYSMVDRLANVIPNINQFYMAGLMAAPMAIIELALMGSMYKNRKLNLFIILISCIVLIMCFLFIRNQTAVSERQFLKSMIPHHASAILMVKETEISDPEIKQLANDIISSQQKEIEFMKAKLKEMDKK